MTAVPPEYHDLFERPTIAHVVTMLPSGMPHATPVWIDYDPDLGYVQFNTETGRRKERNVRQDPRVGVSMCDPDDPYRYCSLWGEVVEITTEGAVEQIDALTRRYFGESEYPHHDEEEGDRVTVSIDPEHVITG